MLIKSLLLSLALAACSHAPTQTSQVADSTPVATSDSDQGFEFAARHGRRHRVPPRIQRFDQNRDGVLEANEVPPRLKTWFAEVDQNHDGMVTAQEIRTFNRAHHAHRPQPQAQRTSAMI